MIRGACSRVLRLSYSKLKHANLKLWSGSLSSLLRQRPIHSVQSSASVHLIIKDSERRSHLNKIWDTLLKINVYWNHLWLHETFALHKTVFQHSGKKVLLIFKMIFFSLLFKNSCNSCHITSLQYVSPCHYKFICLTMQLNRGPPLIFCSPEKKGGHAELELPEGE